MTETHILRAKDRHGNVGFYNGRAGKDWLSASPDQAFSYTAARAENQVERFNRTSSVHGQRFVAVSKETFHVAAIEATAGNPFDGVADIGC